VLHIFALAYLTRNKDYLTLEWRGNDEHVKYGTNGSILEDGGNGAAQRHGSSQDQNREGLKVVLG
jgi:hypothetical protein